MLKDKYEIGEKPGVRGTSIILSSGNYFDYMDPENSPILIDDIANGLSRICRFGGQLKPSVEFYSVAQHSVLVSSIVPDEHKFAALMHDAGEAYAQDIVGPLKQLLPDYKRIEKKIEKAVFERFGLTSDECSHQEIKRADLRLLRTEQRDLTSGNRHDWNGLNKFKPLEEGIDPMLPHKARNYFLMAFEALS